MEQVLKGQELAEHLSDILSGSYLCLPTLLFGPMADFIL